MTQPLHKSPAFQLYVADFLLGVSDFDAEQTGAYILLLLRQWDKGSIPNDQAACAKIGRCSTDAIASIWHKFGISHPEGLKNVRLEKTRAEQVAYRDKQSRNSQKRWKKSDGNPVGMPPHTDGNPVGMPSHTDGNPVGMPSHTDGNPVGMPASGQCSSPSPSIVPLSSPKGDSKPVALLPDAAEKKEGGGAAPGSMAAIVQTVRSICDLFGRKSGVLSAAGMHGLRELADALPLPDDAWPPLAAIIAAAQKKDADPEDFTPKKREFSNAESLAANLLAAVEIARDWAQKKQGAGSAGVRIERTGSMSTAPSDDWRARAQKKWPDNEFPADTEWTALPAHIRTALLA